MGLYDYPVDPHFALFRKFIKERPMLDPEEYDSRSSYNTDRDRVYRLLQRARSALNWAELLGYDHEVMLDALKSSFDGRLSYDKYGELDYCPAQYYPMEYRHVAAVVLETYCREMIRKGREAREQLAAQKEAVND